MEINRESTTREEVLRELLRRRPSLHSFILSIVADFPFSEEVFQEVAVVVCERWEDFQPGTNFGAWTRQIARNKIYSMSRAAGRAVLLEPEAIDRIEQVHQEEDTRDRLGALRQCLGHLGKRPRKIFLLRYEQGLSGDGIARRMLTTVDAVHKILSRVRAELAACIDRRFAQEEAR
jgi:RNA polymerase sigma-70 factor (ECF subfamily)